MTKLHLPYGVKYDKLLVGGKEIKLPCPINKTVDDGNTLIVMVTSKGIDTPSRNVFAFNAAGSEKWVIEEFDFDTPHRFTNIWFDKVTGELMAYNWVGYYFHVDIETGKIRLWKDPETGEVPRPW